MSEELGPGAAQEHDRTGEAAGRSRWQELTGGTSGADYHARFAELAASGAHVHGEADLCAALLDTAGRERRQVRVLDAGCGTGRVAIRLAEMGFSCVGVDMDASMLAVAKEHAPDLLWYQADLAALSAASLGGGRDFDLVVMAGNVVPLLAPGTVAPVIGSLGALLAPGGLLVAGFGLDAEHLPAGCPVTPLPEYDDACAHAGLRLEDRLSSWDGEPFDAEGGYAVSLHRRPG